MIFSGMLPLFIAAIGIQGALAGPRIAQRDSIAIVPLNENIGKGYFPVVFEQGMIKAMGNRFVNILFEDISPEGVLGKCWNRVAVVVKQNPCIYNAVKSQDTQKLLHCGVSKEDTCASINCFPTEYNRYLQQWCNTHETAHPQNLVKYEEFIQKADVDVTLQRFRGTMTNDVVGN